MVNEKYQFFPSKIIIIYQYLIYPVLFLIARIWFGFKVIGKENLKLINGGAITVSNHPHIIDNALIFQALFPQKIYFVTNKINIETSFIRFFTRGLGGIPVPESKKAMRVFIASIIDELKNNKVIHFFPEGKVSTKTVGKFKDGPFRLAANNNVQVIPLTFINKRPDGLLKYFRRKPVLHLIIDKPIENLDYKELRITVYQKITDNLKNLSSSI